MDGLTSASEPTVDVKNGEVYTVHLLDSWYFSDVPLVVSSMLTYVYTDNLRGGWSSASVP